MVVTDLHGDRTRYRRYRDTFLDLKAKGRADVLIFTGDFIHREGPQETDHSLEIILDLLDLSGELEDDLIVLLGNHEMPHLYHVTLAKGEHVYTPRFEAAMGDERERVLSFLDALPLFVRTTAGVTLCHAGAFSAAADDAAMAALRTFDHRALLSEVSAELKPDERPALRRALGRLLHEPYDALARRALAVSGPDDPRYDDYLIGVLVSNRPTFKLLWSALFSTNEREIGMRAYTRQVAALLQALSTDYAPQMALVTGHLGCRNGYRVLAQGRQLRLASGAHAYPPEAGKALLFDAGKPIGSAEPLLAGLRRVDPT